MNIIDSVKCCFSKYATFEGNASRSEFWWFMLFYLVLLLVAITLDGNWSYQDDPYSAPMGTWETIVVLGLFIPVIAVTCRRLHDIGRSGWWQLIALTGIGYFVLLYWWCQKSRSCNQQESDLVKSDQS